MEHSEPIACTLTDADLRDRRRAWLKVGQYSTGSREVPGGLAFDFEAAPGVHDSLRELVRLEGECCAWMSFTLDDQPGRVAMRVTATGDDGERGVRESFAPLSAVARR